MERIERTALRNLIHNEKYFTPEILEKLDEVCAKEFKYGDVIDTEDTTDTPDDQS